MNQRLELYTRGVSINSYGEQDATYTTGGSIWGKVKLMVSDEKLLSNKEQPVRSMSIIARFFDGTTGDRIEYDGYRWEIDGVRRSHRSGNISITANRIHAIAPVLEYYLQPDGLTYYLTPTGDKYQQP